MTETKAIPDTMIAIVYCFDHIEKKVFKLPKTKQFGKEYMDYIKTIQSHGMCSSFSLTINGSDDIAKKTVDEIASWKE
jgi:hypothetical protein